MNSPAILHEISVLVITIGFATIRMAVAFLIMPVFSNQVMPALVRNSVFAVLGLVVVVVQPLDVSSGTSALDLILLLLKEAYLGLSIGVLFGLFLWAFEAAGELIDTQVGSAQAQILDPISGHEITLYGEFLGRFANWMFMALGGLSMLTGVLLQSYAIWPIGSVLPRLQGGGFELFTDSLGGIFSLIILLAAPALAVILLIDVGMGLLNRFAQRLNVFFLSNSLKSLVAIFIVLLMLPILITTMTRTLDVNAADVLSLTGLLFE